MPVDGDLRRLPGRKHGAAAGPGGQPQALKEKIVAWVENGEKPGVIKRDMTTGPGKTLDIAPY